MTLKSIDLKIVSFFRKIYLPLTRLSLFVVFFWFGALKVIGQSPATELVQNLFEKTVPLISFQTFIIGFGVLECTIGIIFLLSGLERIVIPILFLHMFATCLPLILLPQEMWSAFLVPTMEGQYVIKNLLIIAAAVVIGAQLEPYSEKTLKI